MPKNNIDWTKVDDIRAVVLAGMGFSTQCILEHTNLTAGQVSYRIAKAGVSRRDFRNGKGPIARMMMSRDTREVVEAKIAPKLLKANTAKGITQGSGHKNGKA